MILILKNSTKIQSQDTGCYIVNCNLLIAEGIGNWLLVPYYFFILYGPYKMKIQTTNIFKYTLNGACLALRPQEVYDRQGFFHFLALKVSLRHAY